MNMRKWLSVVVVVGIGLAGCHLVAGLGDVDEVNTMGVGGSGAQGGGGHGGMGGYGGGVCVEADCDNMDQECLDFSCEEGTGHCDMGVAVVEGASCVKTASNVCDSQGKCVSDLCVNQTLDMSNGETDVDCGGPACSPCDNAQVLPKLGTARATIAPSTVAMAAPRLSARASRARMPPVNASEKPTAMTRAAACRSRRANHKTTPVCLATATTTMNSARAVAALTGFVAPTIALVRAFLVWRWILLKRWMALATSSSVVQIRPVNVPRPSRPIS